MKEKIKVLADYFKQHKKARILLFSLLILLFTITIIVILIIIGHRETKKEYSRLPETERIEREKSEGNIIQKMGNYLKRGANKVLVNLHLKKAKEIPISQTPTTPPPFDTKPFEKGYQLGKIVIALEDLEKRFNFYYPNTPSERSNLKNWQYIASLITKEAILQSEAIKAGILLPTDTRFDPKKVNIARDYFEKEGTSYINGEAISIWFYNTKPPAMGVEAAKKKTRGIIESLRNKIILGEINMKKAGEMIASMEDLKEIDFAYKTNAYLSFNFVKPTDKLFNDPDLNNSLWKLNDQELSPILIGKDFSPKEGWYEAYFVVIKINAKKMKEFNNMDELIQKRIKDGFKINLKNI